MIVFRPMLRHYLSCIAQFLLFGLVFIAMGWGFLQGLIPTSILLICGLWPVLFVGTAVLNIYRLRKTTILMDEQNFQAQIRKSSWSVSVPWDDVVMIRRVEKFLEVATQSNRYIIHLQHLNCQQIWERIQQYAPASAFDQNACIRVQSYQQMIFDYEALLLLQRESYLYRAGYSPFGKTVRWLFFLGLLFPGILLLINSYGELIVPVIYIISVTILAGGSALRSLRTLEISLKKVGVSQSFLRRELDWDEIERIEADRQYRHFFFYGKGKRLIAPGLRVWGQNDKIIYNLICAQAWEHRIKLEDQNHRYPRFLLNNLPSP